MNPGAAAFSFARAGVRALLLAASVAGMGACASRRVVGFASGAPVEAGVGVPPSTDSVDAERRAEPPTVRVRDIPSSPYVTVSAWPAAEGSYGLRIWIRRDGSVGRGDHEVYVSAASVIEGSVRRAVTPPQNFRLTGLIRDSQNCYGGVTCTPYETYGALIPNRFLRNSRDSLAVIFFTPSGTELIITVRRNLIDAYLAAVDSVRGALRKK